MKMKKPPLITSGISILLISCVPLILCQQPYIRQLIEDCDVRDNSTSVLGYTCNGVRRTCQAYLTFRAQPPYDSVSAISTLLAANSSQLAQLNSVSENAVLDTNRVVLVPVTCSCSGQQYQANTSYNIRPGDSYFVIANNTFQGLSTCQALQVQNNMSSQSLGVGRRLTVPLRCACPTQNQTDGGTNYLLSYLVTWNQFVSAIATLFGVDTSTDKTLAANGLSETDTIYPFTTLLVPLENPPTSSQVTAPQPPPPPSGTPLPSAPTSGGGSSKTWIYIVVGVVGGLALVSAVGAVVFFQRKKRKEAESVMSTQSFKSVEKPLKKDGDSDYDDSRDFLESISSIAQSLKVYPFQQLKDATEGFSPNCQIKGSVYRGAINGDLAAIKKMSGDVSKEITLLNKINHFNLIRLSGVSFNEGNWYLVYEYALNGALADRIQQKILTWKQRLQIALDVAAGLNYLHQYTEPPHIHKDLNSSNILIDHEFRAKIANFSLARSTEGQESQFALTRHIVGTKGYMAPEYLDHGVVSPKLDVYSFGVVLLELLTGKDVSTLYEEVRSMQLPEILAPVLSEGGGGDISALMDPLLEGNYHPELALVLFRMIDSCLKKDPSARPSMDEVLQTLSRVSTSMPSGELVISISDSVATPR